MTQAQNVAELSSDINSSGVLQVVGGGTGATSATAYAVQCGGTTSTAAHQSVASVGTTGQVLTSNGAGALPTFQTAAAFATGTVLLFYQSAAPTGWTQVTTAGLNDSALRITTSTGGSTGGTTAFSTVFTNQTPTGTVATTNTATTATMASYTPAGSISVTVGAGSLAVGAGTFAVGATTLSIAQIPSHTHFYYNNGSGYDNPYNVGGNRYLEFAGAYTGYEGGGGSHTHGLTGSPSLSGSPSVTAQSFTGTAATLTQNSHNHTATSTFTGSALTLNVKYVNIIMCSKD